jgi:uncharacterized cofD-like protein
VHKPIKRVYLKPASPVPAPEAIKAIEEAEIIVLGPGSLYTSIIPNLLVKNISDKIVTSKAIKVYVCNVMTQPGETDGYSASAHIRALAEHSDPGIIDYCIVNTGKLPVQVLKRYEEGNAYSVSSDRKIIQSMGYRLVEEDTGSVLDGVIRHDHLKLAKVILSLQEEL